MSGDLQNWRREGFGFGRFTRSEARYLEESAALIYRRVPRHERRKRVQAALDTVGLAHRC